MKLILASTSPRRIELLRRAGLRFKMVRPVSDELSIRGESPRAMVQRLSLEKGLSVLSHVKSGEETVIISADTIVVAPNGKTVLGKPKNTRDAFRMLKMLLGKTHTVLTGFTLIHLRPGKPAKRTTRVVKTQVSMRSFDPATIRRYIASEEPMDKAGSYAAQGIGMALIEKVRGSYTNVVGLPISHLLQELEKRYQVRVFGKRK